MQRGIPGLMQETRSPSQVSPADALMSYRAAQVILSDVGHQQSRGSLLVSPLDLSDAIHNVPCFSSRCHREARCALMETAGSEEDVCALP